MYNSWYDVFPEIVMISDKELQKKVVETYEEALKTGGWQLAVKHRLPVEVAHIIANHAKEGDGTLRSPEGVIVNKCDMLNFEGLKAFVGMI